MGFFLWFWVNLKPLASVVHTTYSVPSRSAMGQYADRSFLL